MERVLYGQETELNTVFNHDWKREKGGEGIRHCTLPGGKRKRSGAKKGTEEFDSRRGKGPSFMMYARTR